MKSTEILIEEIKSVVSEDQYKSSLEKLKGLFDTSDSLSMDEFSVECLALFHDDEIGFPQELYRGLNKEEVKLFIKELAKDLKAIVCKLFANNPDKDFTNMNNDALKDIVKFYISSTITQTGSLSFFVTLYVCSIVQYCISRGITFICN